MLEGYKKIELGFILCIEQLFPLPDEIIPYELREKMHIYLTI